MDAGDVRLGEPGLDQPRDALRMRPGGAEATEVEGARGERGADRRIVELGIVGQRDDGRARVEPDRGQRLVGPVVAYVLAGEAGGGPERLARVHDHRIVAAGP